MDHRHKWKYLQDDLMCCEDCNLLISAPESCEYLGHVWLQDTCLACGIKKAEDDNAIQNLSKHDL